jgi:hypothetical protein
MGAHVAEMHAADAPPPSIEPACALSRCDSSGWPLRMTRAEVAHVQRITVRTLFNRIRAGKFPGPGDDRMWSKAVVVKYVERGRIRAA